MDKRYSWMLGGLIVALIGIIVWLVVGYFFHTENDSVAFGIGGAIGLTIRQIARRNSKAETPGQGAFAFGLSLLTILTAKYLLFILVLLPSEKAEQLAISERLDGMSYEDEAMTARIAERFSLKTEQSEEALSPAPEDFLNTPLQRDAYPQDVWRQAERQWRYLGRTRQEEMRDQFRREVEEVKNGINLLRFRDCFSIIDIFLFFVASVAALRIAAAI
jgi:hypothetical protein